jgi:hypothetical protein
MTYDLQVRTEAGRKSMTRCISYLPSGIWLVFWLGYNHLHIVSQLAVIHHPT